MVGLVGVVSGFCLSLRHSVVLVCIGRFWYSSVLVLFYSARVSCFVLVFFGFWVFWVSELGSFVCWFLYSLVLDILVFRVEF